MNQLVRTSLRYCFMFVCVCVSVVVGLCAYLLVSMLLSITIICLLWV